MSSPYCVVRDQASTDPMLSKLTLRMIAREHGTSRPAQRHQNRSQPKARRSAYRVSRPLQAPRSAWRYHASTDDMVERDTQHATTWQIQQRYHVETFMKRPHLGCGAGNLSGSTCCPGRTPCPCAPTTADRPAPLQQSRGQVICSDAALQRNVTYETATGLAMVQKLSSGARDRMQDMDVTMQ